MPAFHRPPLGLLVPLLLLASCASSTRYHCYPGMPRPAGEVATVVLQHHLMWISLDEHPVAKFPKIFDLPAGDHSVEVIYTKTGETFKRQYSTAGRRTTIPFTAKPGHIYYVYPTFPGSNTWAPKIQEFADTNALRNFHPGFVSALEDGERLLDRVTDHFGASQAHSMTVQANQQWE